MIKNQDILNIEIGVVGLGLMGSSIVVALLISGHPVKGIAPKKNDMKDALPRIIDQLKHAEACGLLERPIEAYLERLTLSEDYHHLKDCQLVQECVTEVEEIKGEVYQKIVAATGMNTIISSNTSAIPISILQKLVPNPSRFMGVHWAEPAYMTRFLEITKGEQTAEDGARWVLELAHFWDKEPTFLRKDIRGFVTNRLMYAVYREIFHLIENGETTVEDADKSFRYDAGSWMTFMGVFQRMDQLGLEDFAEAFGRIFPTLCNSDKVPLLMQRMVEAKARGIQNQRGLYSYTAGEAQEWERSFAAFNEDIYHLASAYSPTRKKKQFHE
ncbi:3-hydroxyacyl-CoA dehydrogenase family protein [Negadavirga shengliensis]|uniref:3-hydroxyacyl-CoA dehydrogenase family protein n=1 Tax=Negadavirga shengliensis TaxID=1389218 RepID=A0ABV9SZ48_9BACT